MTCLFIRVSGLDHELKYSWTVHQLLQQADQDYNDMMTIIKILLSLRSHIYNDHFCYHISLIRVYTPSCGQKFNYFKYEKQQRSHPDMYLKCKSEIQALDGMLARIAIGMKSQFSIIIRWLGSWQHIASVAVLHQRMT